MSEIFKIRAAREGEQRAIRRIVRAARLNPLQLNWRNFHVAEDASGQIIGCVQIKKHRDGAHELASLIVLPAWRGQGVARRLIETRLGNLNAAVWLMCRASLAPFYRKWGFRMVGRGERKPSYFQRVDRLARLLSRFVEHADQLAIMVREGAQVMDM